jgi:multidrug efflux pump subunit AcrA (membrane-fusion protein)
VISTTKPRGWIALAAVIAILVIAFIWSVVANIPQQSSGLGVISSLAYSEQVTATADGTFGAVNLNPGVEVKEGEILATITPYDGGPVVVVKSPATGRLSSISKGNGAGVYAGDLLAIVQVSPNPKKGILAVTYLSASDAITYTPGGITSVTITNLAQSATIDAQAEVISVSSSPASEQSMMFQAGSKGTVDKWLESSGGTSYRVALIISSPADIPSDLIPQAGQTIQIVNTFGSIHPIELLFGAK